MFEASVAQAKKMMEFQGEEKVLTVIVMLGTNDISRSPITPESKWDYLIDCLLNELQEIVKSKILVLCSVLLKPEVGILVAEFKL